MKTKFDVCLEELCKEASPVSRAGGLGRLGQLLSGSRARALEERAQGVGMAGQRALRVLSNPEAMHAQAPVYDRMTSNYLAAQRAGRAAGMERGAVNATRGLGAGVLGTGALGAYALSREENPTEPGAEPQKKSPYWEGAKVLGTSLAGFGLGQLAGAGIGKGIEHLTKRQGGDAVTMAHRIAPLVGTAAGVIYPIWRGLEQKGISDAVQSARDENERQLPGE